MTVREWIRSNRHLFDSGELTFDEFVRKGVEELKISHRRTFVTRAKSEGILWRSTPAKKKVGIDPEDFLKNHGPSTKTREALREAVIKLKQSDGIIKDSDFRSIICGLSHNTRWASITAEEEFAKYRFVCDRKVWWACESLVNWVLKSIDKAMPS